MNVFVGYCESMPVHLLSRTLDAWDRLDGAEVSVITCPPKRYELYRRICSENLSDDDYLLVDVGCIPVEDNFIEHVAQQLRDNPQLGMLGAKHGDAEPPIPTGVRACRWGIVSRWPAKHTADYDDEHAIAYKDAGYEVKICLDLHYRYLDEQ